MSKIVKISRARFNALCLSRHPFISMIFEEVEWYSDIKTKVLGVILFDKTDDDFGYVILGRDEISMFRAIDMGCSFSEIITAKTDMFKKMIKNAASGGTHFSQGDVTRKKNEIFKATVPPEKLHPSFLKLATLPGFSPAKEIIREAVYAYIDVDGNYIEQFQSTGFDARMWELYLFLAFYEMRFKILREYPAPDYVLQYGESEYICIEAVTVNPTQNSVELAPAMPTSKEELEAVTRGYLPIKFGSALYSKLKKEYWKQEHIVGKPLVFAIADFHQERSMLWSRTALMEYLYGLHTTSYYDDTGKLIIINEKIEFHEYNSKKIPSSFFTLPDTENISGILFSNQGTISKFNRMGKLAGFGERNVRLIVSGFCHDHDPNAAEPRQFTFDVTDPRYDELWVDGLTFYHNPNAISPLPFDVFPEEVGQFYLQDGLITATLPDFYPYGSQTQIIVAHSTINTNKKRRK